MNSFSLIREYPLYLGSFVGILLVLDLFRRLRRGKGEGFNSLVLFGSRIAVLFFLTLAAAGISMHSGPGDSSVPVFIDISESITDEMGKEFLESLKDCCGSQELTLFPFAAEIAPYGIPYTSYTSYQDLRSSWSKLQPARSDLSIALNGSTVSNGAYLLSDGYETKGDVKAALKSLSAPVHPIVPEKLLQKIPSLQITQLRAPQFIEADENVTIETTVSAVGPKRNQVYRADLVMSFGDEEVHRVPVSLQSGEEQLFPVTLPASLKKEERLRTFLDFAPYEAQSENKNLEPKFSSGIEKFHYFSIRTKKKILILGGEKGGNDYLPTLFRDAGLLVDDYEGSKIPTAPLELSAYSVVILNNISRKSLPEGLEGEVSDFVNTGGHLLMIGGGNSFGLGGYIDSKIEELLPVKLLPPQQKKKRLNVAVSLVLDKSGSMKNERKMDFARAAGAEVVKSLKDDDFLNIVAFDVTPYMVLEMGRLREKRSEALRVLNLIFPNLQTRLLAPLDLAAKQLERAPAGRKHMIVLTDGMVPNARGDRPYYLRLIKNLRLEGITVSTFLIGPENAPLLQEIAELGGGTFYRTRNASNLPRLFLQDIEVNAGERTKREQDRIEVIRNKLEDARTSQPAFPALKGYVETEPRKEVPVELSVVRDGKKEPLFAHWNYGSGKVFAFTSDVSGRWSSQWVPWHRFRQFWLEVIEGISDGENLEDDASDPIDYELKTDVVGGKLHVEVVVYTPHSSSKTNFTIVGADGVERKLSLKESAPGLYQGELDVGSGGEYLFRGGVAGRELQEHRFQLPSNQIQEISGAGISLGTLQAIAENTGGQINVPLVRVRGNSSEGSPSRSLSEICAWAALFFLFLSIVWRERN